MIVLSRFLNLSQQYKRYPVFLRREFLKIPLINDQKIQKVEKKNVEGSTRQKKDQNKIGQNNVQNYKKPGIKVCIIGTGVIPLYTAVLLKQYRIINSIHLVDTRDSTGAITDMYHMEICPRINHFQRKDIKQALKEMNIVALMDETDIAIASNTIMQFKTAANYVRQMTDQILHFCPNALVAVFARPVTATLPMISEIFRCSSMWNPNRIIGSTAMYSARIEETVAALLNLERTSVSVPLVGGADASTIVPLLSRAVPFNLFTNAQHKTLLESFRTSDEEIATRFLKESPSLLPGAAAAKLIIALASGLCGFDNIITCAYVRSNILPVCRFFTSELQLGTEGVKRNLGLPKISPTEILQIEQAIPFINEYIDMAITAVRTERVQIKSQ